MDSDVKSRSVLLRVFLYGTLLVLLAGAAASYVLISTLVPEPTPEPSLSEVDQLLAETPPELVFKGVLAGNPVHVVVYNCAIHEIKDGTPDKQIIKVLEAESYLWGSSCVRQWLKAEKGALTVWLGRMAFGAGGCCTGGGTYRTTDGRTWKRISRDSTPW